MTKEIIDLNTVLDQYTDKSNNSIAMKSNKLFLLSNLNGAISRMIDGKSENVDLYGEFIKQYWHYLLVHFKEWKQVFNKEISAYHSRQNSLSTYGITLESIGLVGKFFIQNPDFDFKNYLNKLNDINWSRSNLTDWKYRSINPNGKIIKNEHGIKLTTIRIKELVGIPLSVTEKKMEETFKKEHGL